MIKMQFLLSKLCNVTKKTVQKEAVSRISNNIRNDLKKKLKDKKTALINVSFFREKLVFKYMIFVFILLN